jgi:Family of unknown function (DUF6644)
LSPADALEGLAIARAMRDIEWLYPATQIAHILGFVVLVGSTVAFDLRVLGLTKAISVRALSRHLLPWSLASLFVIVPTGLMMFAANADDLLDNGPFKVKMGLLLAAGMNAAMFRTGPYQTVKSWDTNADAPLLARASVALSIALWIGVIACGRLIAYA